MTIELRWGAATHVGCVREHNEDALVTESPVFAVADGMGGHAAGEVASAMATDGLATLARSAPLDQATVVAALADLGEAILAHAAADGHREGMGTTVAGLVLVEEGGTELLLVFNVGDSRVYRWSEGALLQITDDHSLVEELVRAGQITAEDAEHHPHRNVITRALGIEPTPEPDTWLMGPFVGDRYLACSDGLTNEVTDERLAELLAAHDDPGAAADALVAEAVANGGRDNVSVVVVDVVAVTALGREPTAPEPAATAPPPPVPAAPERRPF